MKTLLDQKNKFAAFKYLVDKGYNLNVWITDPENCPFPQFKKLISTKKIVLFSLQDPKRKEVVDQIVCEYFAVPSELETNLRQLLIR